MEHFGCRAARADGEAVGDRLRAAGLDEGASGGGRCGGGEHLQRDRRSRPRGARLHPPHARLNPEARIVVTGCYAQRAPEELAAMAGVAAVVGNSHKALAPEIILGLADGQPDIQRRACCRASPIW